MKKTIVAIFAIVTPISMYCMDRVANDLARAREKIEKREHDVRKIKEIHFSDHAKKQMEERGISRGEVEKTIKYGTKSINKREKSVKFIRKHIMVIMDLDEKTVITVYASKKNEKDILSQKQRSLESKKEQDIKNMPARGLTKETKDFVRTLNP